MAAGHVEEAIDRYDSNLVRFHDPNSPRSHRMMADLAADVVSQCGQAIEDGQAHYHKTRADFKAKQQKHLDDADRLEGKEPKEDGVSGGGEQRSGDGIRPPFTFKCNYCGHEDSVANFESGECANGVGCDGWDD